MRKFKILSLIIALAVVSVGAQKVEPAKIDQLTREIERYPKDADAYLLRGREYVRLGRLESAIGDFTKAIELSTHSYYISQATLERGDVYIKRGKYALAIADFTTIVGMKTAGVYKIRAYQNRAEAYFRNQENDPALEDLNKAISLGSQPKMRAAAKTQLAESYKLRAAIYCKQGKRATATIDEKKVIDLSPDCPITFTRPGVEIPDPPTARLFDESKFSYQGHLKMVMDGFFVELMNNPDSQGYLMIYPESHRHHRQIERIIREWMRVRRYDNSRLTLVRAPNNSPSLIQMWVVPAGAENPEPNVKYSEK